MALTLYRHNVVPVRAGMRELGCQRLLYSSPHLFLSVLSSRASESDMLSYSILGKHDVGTACASHRKLCAITEAPSTCSDVYQSVHRICRPCFIPYLLYFPLLSSYHVVKGCFWCRTNRVHKSLVMQSSLDYLRIANGEIVSVALCHTSRVLRTRYDVTTR